MVQEETDDPIDGYERELIRQYYEILDREGVAGGEAFLNRFAHTLRPRASALLRDIAKTIGQ